MKLKEYSVTDSIGIEEGSNLLEQLQTSLDGYLGQSYNYDDQGLTEEWMVTFQDKVSSGPSDDDVIRTQIESLMELMLVQVQDKVCNSTDVLKRPPLQLGVEVKEVPVWGIDCYTRKMVELSIEDRVPAEKVSSTSIQRFIEKILLPAINRQPPELAHNMSVCLESIKTDPSISEIDKVYSDAVIAAVRECSVDTFRIHPKGTGVICINPDGIKPHVLVTEYLGEIYPSYRWCEKLDVVEQAQQHFELKPALPDFYNILLERPRQDPGGYGRD